MPTSLVRGGTSKGLFLSKTHDLAAFFPPPSIGNDDDDEATTTSSYRAHLDNAIKIAMNGVDDGKYSMEMQLDGLGGGISSTSKVVVLSPSTRPGFDLDYEFGQVDVVSGDIDWSGTCGNLSAGILHFARHKGLVPSSARAVKIWQVGVGKPMRVEEQKRITESDDNNNNIPRSNNDNNAVRLEFEAVDQERGDAVFGTGNGLDLVLGKRVSIVTGGPNPTAILRESDVSESEFTIEWVDKMKRACVEAIRASARVNREAPINTSVDAMRVAFVSPRSTSALMSPSSSSSSSSDYDFFARVASPTPGRRFFHHALQMSHASSLVLCYAATVSGVETVMSGWGAATPSDSDEKEVRIANPSGGVVRLRTRLHPRDGRRMMSVGVDRTARILFEGRVYLE